MKYLAMKNFRLVLSLIIGLLGLSLGAETIVLKNGQVIKGKVLGHDSEFLTINTDGINKSIPKITVSKVIFTSNSEAQKLMSEKKKGKHGIPNSKTSEDEEEDLGTEIDSIVNEKQYITEKINVLEDEIDKYQKRINKLKEKVTKLKQKKKTKKEKPQVEE